MRSMSVAASPEGSARPMRIAQPIWRSFSPSPWSVSGRCGCGDRTAGKNGRCRGESLAARADLQELGAAALPTCPSGPGSLSVAADQQDIRSALFVVGLPTPGCCARQGVLDADSAASRLVLLREQASVRR